MVSVRTSWRQIAPKAPGNGVSSTVDVSGAQKRGQCGTGPRLHAENFENCLGAGGSESAADFRKDNADFGSNTRHDGTGRNGNESCHQRIFNEILTARVFPHFQIPDLANYLVHVFSLTTLRSETNIKPHSLFYQWT